MEDLLELLHGVLRPRDGVADCPRVAVDFVVVTTFESLIAKEVDGLVFNARDVLLGCEVLETVRLVPTSGEDVKGDLATDGVAVENTSVREKKKKKRIHLTLLTERLTYVRP